MDNIQLQLTLEFRNDKTQSYRSNFMTMCHYALSKCTHQRNIVGSNANTVVRIDILMSWRSMLLWIFKGKNKTFCYILQGKISDCRKHVKLKYASNPYEICPIVQQQTVLLRCRLHSISIVLKAWVTIAVEIKRISKYIRIYLFNCWAFSLSRSLGLSQQRGRLLK